MKGVNSIQNSTEPVLVGKAMIFLLKPPFIDDFPWICPLKPPFIP